jgi:tRNA threonylcarbamoyl adenosine modification protein (Sua5/YciO/YrdC/YwlC family)
MSPFRKSAPGDVPAAGAGPAAGETASPGDIGVAGEETSAGQERRIAVDWDNPSRKVIHEAADVLRQGGVVVLPTDTVYGIAQSVKACPEGPERLFQIKQRPANKPIAWLVGRPSALSVFGAHVPAYAFELAEIFWPGALTIVVHASDAVPAAFRGPDDTVALRMPNMQLDIEIIKKLGSPIATTSANTSGMPAPDSCAHVEPRIRSAADLVLDDGTEHSLVASTVVVCTENIPRIVRQGSVSTGFIAKITGSVVLDDG